MVERGPDSPWIRETEHRQKKQQHKAVLKNPLREYLREAPFRDECPRAWVPPIYEFSEKEIIYSQNAYDRFMPSLELRSPDEHSNFTKYLLKLPSDPKFFYKWVMSASTMQGIVPNVLKLSEDDDYIEQQKKSIAQIRPLRKSYSMSQLNCKWAELRSEAYFKLSYDQIRMTNFPFVLARMVYKAEDFVWGQKNRRKCQFTASTGFVGATVVEGAHYGPRRFYIQLTNTRRGEPGKFFSHHFINYMTVPENKVKVNSRVPGDPWTGPVVIFDKTAAKKGEPVFHPAYLVSWGRKPRHPLSLYKLETGQIIQIRREDLEESLRILPYDLYDYVRPLVVPCKLNNDQITEETWDNFLSQVRATKRIYVASIDRNVLVVSLVKPDPLRSLDKFFCEDPLCIGACVKDPINLATFYEEPVRCADRKKSISSDDISDIGILG